VRHLHRAWQAAITALTLSLAVGCSHSPMLPYSLDLPAQSLALPGAPPIKDARARYRQLLCGLMAATATPCDEVLIRLSDEPPKLPATPTGTLPLPTAQLLFIPGLYDDCARDWIGFYADAIPQLVELGYQVDIAPVSGRSSSGENARRIADFLKTLKPGPTQPLILIGHSKGSADALKFLVDYPDLAKRVNALISIAGAINGSPLADWLVTQNLGPEALLPEALCATGDGGALQSLQRSVRLPWLHRHPLPQQVRYFSLVTVSDPEHIVWPLQYTYERLAEIDPRNDGMLLHSDQMIPGSELLGYLHTDHWRAAYPVEDKIPFLESSNKLQKFPRVLMLRAALVHVMEALAREANH